MTRSRPADVETLACAVAGEYAGRWARAIARTRGDGAAAPWLVDGFAGADLQRAAVRGATVTPPALAFARAAEQAEARVVLVEEDPALLARVEDELRSAGAGDRLRRTSDPAGTEAGEISIVEAPLASVVDRLAEAIGGAPALVRLAPTAVRALPWIVLEPLAMMLPAADLLIRLPQEDLTRVGRFSGPLADFPPHLRRVAESCSAMFADPRHAWLLAWREAVRAGGEEAALAGAVERLRTMLGDAGEEHMVRAARLEAAGAAVHLLLSTPHAEHALELNGAIADAGATPPAASASKRASKSAARSPKSAPAAADASPTPDAVTEAPAFTEAPASAAPASPSAAPEAAASAPPPDVPTADVPAARDAAPPIVHPVPEPGAAEEPAAVLDLFALPAAPEPEPRGPDLRAVADDLYARHAGEKVLFRELLAGLVDTGLAPEQVRSALGILKRGGRAAFRSLDAEGAEVEFPAEAPTPPPPPAPKPRKARKPAPDVLGLFDEPED